MLSACRNTMRDAISAARDRSPFRLLARSSAPAEKGPSLLRPIMSKISVWPDGSTMTAPMLQPSPFGRRYVL